MKPNDENSFENEQPHGESQWSDGVDGAMPENGADVDDPASQMERLKAELAEANHRVLMAHAEVENTRKRLRRDYEEQLKYASLPLMRDILAVLDNLHRALAASGGQGATSGLTEGVSMVVKQFEETLERHHCKPIAAIGEAFDPNFHEAIAQMPSSDVPQGAVAEQAVVGYQYHDRVVRPSQVIVSTGAPNA